MYNEALLVLNKIKEAGFDAYIVGGYARDRYLGIESSDIDICTSAHPKDIKSIFGNVKVNLEYGVSTLIHNGYKYEITTFRHDNYNNDGNRKYSVSFVSTLEEDLKRRDFVMNTLCIGPSGNFIDLMGARKDIDNRVIRCVKSPLISFKEDPLRILRAIRFATTLSFSLDSAIEDSIYECLNLLSKLSFDRRKKELDLIFSSINVMDGISLIKKYKLDGVLELDLNNISYCSNYLGIWAQCNNSNKYNFSNREREIIDSFRV